MPDEGPSSDSTRRKPPTPIRDAVGDGPASKPGSAEGHKQGSESASPGLRGQRERPSGRPRSGGGRKGRKAARPLSARASVEGSASEPTRVEDLPSRTFEVDGQEWIVRLSGKTFAGMRPSSGAPLLALTFYLPDAPTTAVRRSLAVGRSLDQLDEVSLPGLLAGSSSVPEAAPRAEPLPDKG